jgi:hypothetical protein
MFKTDLEFITFDTVVMGVVFVVDVGFAMSGDRRIYL